MNYLAITKHISAQFNTDLEQAMNQVMTMGGLVEKQLNEALTAVNTHDKVLAKKVIEQDKLVNKMEVDISEMCITVIAKRQPTARDLRLLIVIINTVNELERVGDVARKVCKIVFSSSAYEERFRPIQTSIDSLAKRAVDLLRNVLDCYARMDLTEAVKLYKKNEKIEQEYEALVRQLMAYMMEDPKAIPDILTFQNSARALEKIGDRCLKICEYIVYFVRGEDIRHKGQEAVDLLIKEMDLLDHDK